MRRLSKQEFEAEYGETFAKVFRLSSSREDPWPIPFRDGDWTVVAVMAIHELVNPEYEAIERAARHMTDDEVVLTDAEAEPRHQRSVAFAWPGNGKMLDMYTRGPSAVDAALFGKSGTWGVYFCWEPDLAYVGGNADFMRMVVDELGGIQGIKSRLTRMIEGDDDPTDLRLMAAMLEHLGWAEELMGDEYPRPPAS